MKASAAAALAALLAVTVCACGAKPAPTTPPVPRPQALTPPPAERVAFFREIHAKDGQPPANADVTALSLELAGFLGSIDPEIRDGLAYEIFVRWVRTDKRLDEAGLRALTRALYDGLRAGIGALGGDTVYGRSFSALVLSVVAARELDKPYLTDEELTAMVENAAWYASSELDLRGYVGLEARGWAHAAAHTADWLKFLARHPRLGRARAQVVLDAVLALTVRRHGFILHHGEDGRLAQPVLELLRLQQIAPDAFTSFLAYLLAPLEEKGTSMHDPALYAAQRNARNLAFTLFVALSMEDQPNPLQVAALAALRQAIHG